MKNIYTSIRLKRKTRVRMQKIGDKEDTYDSLINKLINIYESVNDGR